MATIIWRNAYRLTHRHLFNAVQSECRVINTCKSRRLLHTSRFVGSNSDLKLTSSCIKQLKKILEGEEFLRVVIEGGGCAGFQYKFEVDKDINEDDKVFQEDGAKVVVDIDSLGLIKGSSIDYQVEMIKASFVVLKNPNVEKGCSCGTSFSIKI